MFLDILGTTTQGKTREIQDQRGGPRESVSVIISQPLQWQFGDWEDVLKLRDATGTRDQRVHFLLGQDEVAFSLDVIDSPAELFHFQEKQQWSQDKYFIWHDEIQRESLDTIKNMIFFSPKSGAHHGQLFRFTVGQHPRLDQTKNFIEPVLSSFVSLLLNGSCDFSEIVYYATVGQELRVTEENLPTLQRKWDQFPTLPLGELLPRSDSHQFIGVDFDDWSCRVLCVSTPKVKKLGFTSCYFSDGGYALFHFLQRWECLTHLVLDACPLTRLIPPILKPLKLKSLAIGQNYLLQNNRENNHPSWEQDLCSNSPLLSQLQVVLRDQPLQRMTKKQWVAFFSSVVRDHPKLQEIDFLSTHTFPRAFSVASTALQMVRVWPDATVTRLRRMRFLAMDGNNLQCQYPKGSKMDKVNQLLRNRPVQQLCQLSSRGSLIPRAVEVASRWPGNHDHIFAILSENADILG